MAGLFGSITVKGNRLTEFATQTASVGIPIPFGYGRFPCEGNIGFAPMPPKEHVKKKKQGKGGVKTEEYTYTLSYAIMFCEGPIFGYWTIKRNGKVVWTQDPNASVEDAAYAAKWAQKATFYYGTETQLPDSTIESYKGAGNVSAFRGIAYIVVEDDDVTDNGGAVPTYEAVVMATPPEAYLTSKLYPQKIDDAVSMSLGVNGGNLVTLLYESTLQESETEMYLSVDSGDLYEVPPPEFVDDTEMSLVATGGELKIPPPANIEKHEVELGLSPTGGQLKIPPVGTLQADALEIGLTPTGGALYVP